MDYLLSLTDVSASVLLLIVIIFLIFRSGVGGFALHALLVGVAVRIGYIAAMWVVGVPLYIDLDSYDFLLEGRTLAADSDFFASIGFGSQCYRWFLGRIFNLLGYAPITASILSLFAWTVALLVVADLWRLVRGGSVPPFLILILSVIPFHIFLTASAMREAWQMLGIVLFIRFLTEISSRDRLDLSGIAYGVAGSVIMGATHYALLGAMPVVIGMMLLARGIMKSKGSAALLLWSLALVASLAGGVLAYITYVGEISEVVSLEYDIRQRNFGALTYTIPVEATPEMMPLYAPLSFTRFYLGPWPWDVGSVEALYVMLEGWGRSLLLFLSISNFRRAAKDERMRLLATIVGVVVISAIWAIGTYNFGTATRHAATVLPLLLVSGWLIRAQNPAEGRIS